MLYIIAFLVFVFLNSYSIADTKLDSLYIKAENYYYFKDYESAMKSYKEIIRISPKDLQSHYNLALIYFNIGKLDSSEIWIDKLSQLVKDDDMIQSEMKTLYYNIGVTYYNQRKYSKAISSLNKAVKINPKDFDAHYFIGLCYYAMDDMSSAMNELKIAEEINPQNDKAKNVISAIYFSEGRNYLEQKDFAKSEEMFLKGIKYSQDPELYLGLAISILYQSKFDSAFSFLKKNQDKILIEPSNKTRVADVYLNIGAGYYRNQEYDKSANAFKIAMELNPTDETVMFYLGYVLMKQERYDEAYPILSELVKIQPNNDKYKTVLIATIEQGKVYYLRRAINYQNENKPDYAIVEYEKALKLDPNNAEAKDALAKLRRNPTQLQILYTEGNNYLLKKDYPSAINSFEKLLEIDPNYVDGIKKLEEAKAGLKSLVNSYYQEGVSAQNKGDWGKAVYYFRLVIYTDPNNQSAKEKLSQVQPLWDDKVKSDIQQANDLIAKGGMYQAIKILEGLAKIEQNNKEIISLLDNTKNQFNSALKSAFDRGISAYNKDDLESAKIEFYSIIQADPEYRFSITTRAKEQLDKINTKISQVTSKSIDQQVSQEEIQKLYSQGIDFYLKGEYKLAIEKWEQVLKLDPENAKAKKNIESAKKKLNLGK